MAVTNSDLTAGTDSGTGADWTNPHADDDEDRPFCTTHTTDSSTYACEKIKCIVQRPMSTTDEFDFQFRNYITDSATDDSMTINPGRAILGVNQADCSQYCAYLDTNLYDRTDAT